MPTIKFLQLQMDLKGLRARKGLGQHFLVHEPILDRIAEATTADARTLVLEIGPGPGFLTTRLAARAGGVMAVDLDERLRPIHEDGFASQRTVRFAYADALRLDLGDLARGAAAEMGLARMVAAGNLPFQITSPLLFGQCGPGVPWERMVFMVQKEVADRIVSPPGNRDYGVLTVKLGLWWRASRLFDVPAARFQPAPEVDASVLQFEPRPAEECPPAKIWPRLSSFIDAGFSQRRKKLINSLAARWGALPGKAEAAAALATLGHSENARAEELSPGEFRRLFQVLHPAG